MNMTPLSISENENKAGVTSASRGTARVSCAKTVGQKQVNQFKGLSVLPIVTIVFIACFLPHLVSAKKEMRHAILLHSVINPFIYSFMSKMFRNDIRQFSRKVRSKLTVC